MISFGLVFLAGNLGFIDAGYFYRLGQLWPLWLVVGGFLLLSKTYPNLRLAAGGVVGLMLLLAILHPAFLDSFHGYRYWQHSWGAHSFWGLLDRGNPPETQRPWPGRWNLHIKKSRIPVQEPESDLFDGIR